MKFWIELTLVNVDNRRHSFQCYAPSLRDAYAFGNVYAEHMFPDHFIVRVSSVREIITDESDTVDRLDNQSEHVGIISGENG